MFLRGIIVVYESSVLWFSLLGIITAILLGYGLFKGMVRINLKKFFNITSTLLILFAAGLFAHGTHELQEAGIIPVVIEHLWDINPESAAHPFHENGVIGSVLKSIFGYNGNPSLVEVLSYLAFFIATFGWWLNFEKKQKPVATA